MNIYHGVNMDEKGPDFQNVFENCFEAVIIATSDGRILNANKSACQMFRMSVDELIATGREGLVEMSGEEFARRLAERDADGKLFMEIKLVRKGGESFPAEVSSKKFSDPDGQCFDVIVIRENNEKANILSEHRRLETLLKAALHNSPIIMYAVDMQGRFTFTDGDGLTGTGIAPGEHVGISIYDLYGSMNFTEADGSKVIGKKLFDRVFKGELTKVVMEMGGIVYDNYMGPVFDPENKQSGIVGVGVNITDKVTASNLLKEKEADLRSMIENTDGPIWSLDMNFRLIDCNANYLKRFRIFFGTDVRRGDNIIDFIPDDFREEWKGYYLRGLSGQSFRIQSTTHPPLAPEYLRYYFNPIVLESGEVVGVTVSGENITDLMKVTNDLRDTAENLRALSVHIKDVVENERTTIAHELHDDLGQKLTAINMNLSWLKSRTGDKSKKINEKFEETLAIINDALSSTRRISKGLRPVMLDDLGLVPTIKWQIGEFTKTTGIKCRYSFRPQEIQIDNDLALNIFRIVQEALTNVARHSDANDVSLNLEAGEDEINITLKDNGKGIDSTKVISNHSLGILGMKERVEMLKGKLIIEGSPAAGTTVKVSFPLK